MSLCGRGQISPSSAGGPGAGVPRAAGAARAGPRWAGPERRGRSRSQARRAAGEGLPSRAGFWLSFDVVLLEYGFSSGGSALGPVSGFHTLETRHTRILTEVDRNEWNWEGAPFPPNASLRSLPQVLPRLGQKAEERKGRRLVAHLFLTVFCPVVG